AWLLAPWSAAAFAEVIQGTITALDDVHALPTWVLSNHDVTRHPTRYGGGQTGVARGRAATLAMLALPGSAYLYQGEELGLEEVDVAPDDRQDPAWVRHLDGAFEGAPVHGTVGRDGCRVPIPWSGDQPPFGFGPGSGQPWLPQPPEWGTVSVAAQETDDASTLAFYRRALAARREHAHGSDLLLTGLEADDEVLRFRRGRLHVVLNAGATAIPLPAGEVVLASGPLEADSLPPDTAVWLT
ncbi:alpha-amylase family glycosyl hydrolase, partial [Nocardioides sp.]|uniref:alpha-amylase family glycosyl hydrolase n=1 Tax=Nocardioides sp. TaxID=35761 RepID=UPI0035656508